MPIGLPADAATLRKHSTGFIIYGMLLIALGAVLHRSPDVATLAVTLTVGGCCCSAARSVWSP